MELDLELTSGGEEGSSSTQSWGAIVTSSLGLVEPGQILWASYLKIVTGRQGVRDILELGCATFL